MSDTYRIAAVGDLHIRTTVPSEFVRQAYGIEDRADILVITGDITNGGRIQEVELAAEFLAPITIPKITVLGNHDRRTTRRKHFIRLLGEAGVEVLDGTAYVSDHPMSVGFAGAGGSGGGFWPIEGPENPMNRAMQAMAVRARREADRLDKALNTLETTHKIAVLHFAPTITTLVGEPELKYPLLGNSVLGEVVDHHQVDLVLHGHSHIGTLQGETPGGTLVRNVAAGVTGGITIHTLSSAGLVSSEVDLLPDHSIRSIR